VLAELSRAEAHVTRELMVDEESYMDTATIDRIVGMDISARDSLLVSCAARNPNMTQGGWSERWGDRRREM